MYELVGLEIKLRTFSGGDDFATAGGDKLNCKTIWLLQSKYCIALATFAPFHLDLAAPYRRSIWFSMVLDDLLSVGHFLQNIHATQI